MCTGMEIAMIAGTVMSAASSVQQGKQQSAMADYNRQVAENEALAARQLAEYQEQQHRERTIPRVRAAQRAALAAAGGEISDSGDVIDISAEDMELDALMIRYGGKTAAQAASQRAELARVAGNTAQQQGYMQAGSTLLSGAGSYYGNKQPGATTIKPYSSPSYNQQTGRTGMR